MTVGFHDDLFRHTDTNTGATTCEIARAPTPFVSEARTTND